MVVNVSVNRGANTEIGAQAAAFEASRCRFILVLGQLRQR